MEMPDYLKLMVKYDASDLYFTTGAPVSAKVQGMIKPIDKATLPAGRVKDLAYGLMNEEQIRDFEHKPEMNLAHSETGVGRFRVNIFQQRNQTAMVIRNIKTDIPSPEFLGLPPILKKVIMQKRGLILHDYCQPLLKRIYIPNPSKMLKQSVFRRCNLFLP